MRNKTSTGLFALLLVLAAATVMTLKAQLKQTTVPPSPSVPQPVEVPGMEHSLPIDAALWRNAHQVLRLDGGGLGAAVVDTISGSKTPVPHFTAILGRQTVSGPFGVSLSPDGNWLLWHSFSNGPQSRPIWIAAALDGSRVVTWPRDGAVAFPKIAWMQDNRHWLEVQNGEELRQATGFKARVLFYSLDKPGVKTLPLQVPDWVSGCWFTPKGHLVVASLVGGAGTDDVYDFAFPAPQPVRKVTLSLPATDVTECALSPQGDRFAWQLYKVHLSPRANLAERAVSLLLRRQTAYTHSIWVSDLDGGNLRQITPETERAGPAYIHWTPDGKSIGYRYSDALWIVPAQTR